MFSFFIVPKVDRAPPSSVLARLKLSMLFLLLKDIGTIIIFFDKLLLKTFLANNDKLKYEGSKATTVFEFVV